MRKLGVLPAFVAIRASALVICSLTLFYPDFAEARRGGFLSSLMHAAGHTAVHSAAHAAGTQARKSTPVKNYGPDTLTLAQLESCVVQAKALDQNGETIDASVNSLKAFAEETKSLKVRLETQRTSLVKSSQSAIDRYNAQVDLLNERIDQYKSRAAIFKTQEDKFNSSIDSYNAICTKKYYVDDMAIIKAKLDIK